MRAQFKKARLKLDVATIGKPPTSFAGRVYIFRHRIARLKAHFYAVAFVSFFGRFEWLDR